MKIVPNGIGEKSKLQQGGEKRKAKTLKNKILQNVGHQQHTPASISNSSPNEMTDERKTNNSNNNNNNSNSNQIKSTSSGVNVEVNNKQIESTDSDAEKTLGAVSKDSVSSPSNNNNNNNSNNNNNNNNNSELIIAEAAKILLKNGLNGTNAAAAAAVVLTAAANFQLPSPPLSLESGTSAVSTNTNPTTAAAAHAQLVAIAAAAAAVNATNRQHRLTNLTSTPNTQNELFPAATAAPAATTTTNNGFSLRTPTTTTTGGNDISSSCSSSKSMQHQFTKPPKTLGNNMSVMDAGVIDYTINSDGLASKIAAKSPTSVVISPSSTTPPLKGNGTNVSGVAQSHNNNNNNNNNKYSGNFHNHNGSNHGSSGLKSQQQQHNRCERGKSPSSQSITTQHSGSVNNTKFHSFNSYSSTGTNNDSNCGGAGGRLQFFKDGKFILELARAKDGEKSRWISVPRKHFRAPSAATSSTVTPSATICSAAPSPVAVSPSTITASSSGFPKNECSNSLSFSDDNSSIQSSPWQRDHCWKQAMPRKNISKEMSLFYQRPAHKQLSAKALFNARKKFRKPYNLMSLNNEFLYVNSSAVVKNGERSENGKNHNPKNEINGYENGEATEAETEAKKSDKAEKSGTASNNILEAITDNDCKVETKLDGKLKVGSEGELNSAPKNSSVDTASMQPDPKYVKGLIPNRHALNKMHRKLPGKAAKAKLLTIIQKLTDSSKQRLAKNVYAASKSFVKTGSTVSATLSQQNLSTTTIGIVGHKVSPPSANTTSSASRLADYHQQHVSPRKRILREFEKVSLEDNGATAVAKRSRARRCSNAASITPPSINSPSHAALKPPACMQQTKIPLPSSSSSSLSSGNNNAVVYPDPRTIVSGAGNTGKIPSSIHTAPTTKVYSSYSIHSLLSDQGGGSSSLAKKKDSSSNNQSYHSQALQNASSASPKSPESNFRGGGKSPSNTSSKTKRSPPYASPGRDARSPSTGCLNNYLDYGRRTPDAAHSSFHKLRYAGNLADHHIPSTNHHQYNQQPQHHQHQHHHPQQHYLHHAPLVAHQQTYYSPYMTSPQYIPAPNDISPRSNASASSATASSAVGTSISTSAQIAAASSSKSSSIMALMDSRSPHRHPSAFRAATPTTASTTYIPTQRDLSSPTRSITVSPRDTAPRTVPKKTASIRRQFASPANDNNNHNNRTNCSSPTLSENRINGPDEGQGHGGGGSNERPTPISLMQQQQTNLLQRSSPSTSGVGMSLSPLQHSYPYHMYAPAPVSSSAGAPPPPPPTANAPPPPSSYIPAVVGSPYYHPYISTLAAMRHPQIWMQHYQSTAPALLQARHSPLALPSSRLSPPYHGFHYNGGMGNALAAAVAAAAGFGSTAAAVAAAATHHPGLLPTVALPQSSLFAHMNNPNLDSGSLAALANAHVPNLTSGIMSNVSLTTDNTSTAEIAKTTQTTSATNCSSVMSSSAVNHGLIPASLYSCSANNKDEQSSDVPLNLSKH